MFFGVSTVKGLGLVLPASFAGSAFASVATSQGMNSFENGRY